MKKITFVALCAILMISCASKRAAIVDFTIMEAKTLQELAKVDNLAVSKSADSLIIAAEKQSDERQTELAFVLADEAVLQLHFSMIKQEQQILAAENKKAADSLTAAEESLEVYRSFLRELKNTPKEQVTH